MEENKNEAQPQEQAQQENKSAVLKYALGGGLVVLGLVAVIGWRQDLWTLIKGSLGVIMILAGVITFAIAKE